MFNTRNRYSFKLGLPKRVTSSSLFSLRYDTNSLSTYHISIVLGKKIDRRAVVRNKLRRQFREVLKELIRERDISYSMVFFLKKDIMIQDRKYIKIHTAQVLQTI